MTYNETVHRKLAVLACQLTFYKRVNMPDHVRRTLRAIIITRREFLGVHK